MPIKKAAFKHLRQTKKRTARNNAVRKRLRALRREIRLITEGGRQGDVRTVVPRYVQALDKAAKVGVIKKNAAARTKSRLMRRLGAALRAGTA